VIMAAPVFGPDWMDKPQKVHDRAFASFMAAVATARQSSDEGIKQVRSYKFLSFLSFLAIFHFRFDLACIAVVASVGL
jgi:hypothetical protein